LRGNILPILLYLFPQELDFIPKKSTRNRARFEFISPPNPGFPGAIPCVPSPISLPTLAISLLLRPPLQPAIAVGSAITGQRRRLHRDRIEERKSGLHFPEAEDNRKAIADVKPICFASIRAVPSPRSSPTCAATSLGIAAPRRSPSTPPLPLLVAEKPLPSSISTLPPSEFVAGRLPSSFVVVPPLTCCFRRCEGS
ncbi:Os04g0280700, partial [Oryza sativa Japonica Group]